MPDYLKSLLVIFFLFNCPITVFAQADSSQLLRHLTALTNTQGFRNYRDTATLNKAADYIHAQFSKYSNMVEEQVFYVNGIAYRNIICRFGPADAPRIIAGAHYDVCGDQPGADDNGSGTVALLELARLLSEKKLTKRIDLIAYTLEEPPFFDTENMGSYHHAKMMHDQNVEVVGMVSIEMIGYFTDEKSSQDYPAGFLRLFYGGKGNFITMVKKFGGGKFPRRFARTFNRQKLVRTKKFTGPPSLPGVDFSDHRNYWLFGFPALMVTDTSFYRNKNYHEATDTIETLDLTRMTAVVDSVYLTLLKMAK